MRRAIRKDIVEQVRRRKLAAVYVTHDVEEALFLASRIIVMAPRPGRITESLDVDFGRRYLSGQSARAVKSLPEFIAMREHLMAAIAQASQAEVLSV